MQISIFIEALLSFITTYKVVNLILLLVNSSVLILCSKNQNYVPYLIKNLSHQVIDNYYNATYFHITTTEREKSKWDPKEKESTKNFKTIPRFQAESDKKVNIT